MPRKKKTEETGNVENAEKAKEVLAKAEENMKKIIGEDKFKDAVAALNETMGESEEKTEKVEETGEEEEKPKKRGKKKLSEEELKRVMTDTKETLVPLTDYISCSVHLGTKVITPEMRKFVYKRRADGLAVFNTNMVDDKIREAIKFLNDFAPEDIFIAGKREALWPAIEKFSEVTGIKCFCKKYPAGIITNTNLENFFETKLIILCDPWVDKNAMNDALKVQVPIVGICDTNNYVKGVTQIIAANNKSRKSVGLILYILAREYLKARGKEKEAKALKMEDFAGKVEAMEEKIVKNKETGEEEISRKLKERLAKVSEQAEEGV